MKRLRPLAVRLIHVAERMVGCGCPAEDVGDVRQAALDLIGRSGDGSESWPSYGAGVEMAVVGDGDPAAPGGA